MLALVKKPRIEISAHGERIDELLEWIRKKYDVAVLASDDEDADESIAVEETEFWQEMEKNRIGNLLAAARLKAGLTQTQVAEKVGIRQNMLSDYEHGRRSLSRAMATRLSKALGIKEERLRFSR